MINWDLRQIEWVASDTEESWTELESNSQKEYKEGNKQNNHRASNTGIFLYEDLVGRVWLTDGAPHRKVMNSYEKIELSVGKGGEAWRAGDKPRE